jgi:hypothetical protein
VVYVLQPGKQALVYYKCKYPEMALDDVSLNVSKSKAKINWMLIIVLICSILIHVILNVRFKVYKHQIQNSVQILQKNEQTKHNILFDLDNKTVVDFTKSSVPVLMAASIIIFLATILNVSNSSRIDRFPSNMIIFGN